ncbi:sensor histidine kinase [Kovacikia minuta CCNUW1]|uniref:sensor histidine kinase n=1 Tax=Kovacikia minuta TaxID=2931930 RepID=UPI001CCDFEC1|nr:sensor histidine kinase [Kovacikia minuta]UBF26166.1 sensor histidine kinase [Kovacikia minuta CCNUW1]
MSLYPSLYIPSLLAFIYFCQAVTDSTLLSERQAKEELAAAHEQLRQYALQIEELAAVQERNHIAREIHDSLGHTLTAQNIQLQTAAKLWQRDPNKAHSFLQQAQPLAATAMQEDRRSVRALREDSEEPPLEEAIAHLVKDFQQGTGIAISTSITGHTIICPRMRKTLYRIVQEALTNIRKYAQATQVNIQLSTTATDVNLVIEDNGQGFDASQQSNGFGLQGMRERVAASSGTLQLETEPGRGCHIIVKIPFQHHSARTERNLSNAQSLTLESYS